jgi:hypothetical protein
MHIQGPTALPYYTALALSNPVRLPPNPVRLPLSLSLSLPPHPHSLSAVEDMAGEKASLKAALREVEAATAMEEAAFQLACDARDAEIEQVSWVGGGRAAWEAGRGDCRGSGTRGGGG